MTLRDAADYILKLPKAEQNIEPRPRPQTCERLRATLNPESADTFAAVAQHAISRRHLESSELVRPSRPSPPRNHPPAGRAEGKEMIATSHGRRSWKDNLKAKTIAATISLLLIAGLIAVLAFALLSMQ